MSKKLSKFSKEKFESEHQTLDQPPTVESPLEDLKVDFKIECNIVVDNIALALETPDYVSIALEKIRTVAHDASAEIVARVAAVEALHARGETGLEEVLVSCLARKATNGAEYQVRAAKMLLEIAEKK